MDHAEFLLEASRIIKSKALEIQLKEKYLESVELTIDAVGKFACKYCLSSWSDGNFTLRTKSPSKQKKKKLLPKESTKMVLKCMVCLKSKRQLLIAPEEEKTETVSSVSEVEPIKLKKKKRKKDKFAGLNVANVNVSVENNEFKNHPSSKIKCINPNSQILNASKGKKLTLTVKTGNVKKKKKKKHNSNKKSSLSNFINMV